MSSPNPIHEKRMYFLTLTVVDWVDVFTRLNHKQITIDSLTYCQKEKGLDLYGWCLMSNHLHMIAACREESKFTVNDFFRDFKKFTSKKIIALIKEEPESRRDWMLNRFEYASRNDVKIKEYKFWQDGNEPKEILQPAFFFCRS